MTVWYCAIVISSHPSPRRETRAVFKQLGTLDSATSPGCDTFPSPERKRLVRCSHEPCQDMGSSFLSPADAGSYSSTHSLAGRISRRESFISSDFCPGCGFPWYDCICHPQWNAKDSPSVGFSTPTTTKAHTWPGGGSDTNLLPAPIPWLNTTYHP